MDQFDTSLCDVCYFLMFLCTVFVNLRSSSVLHLLSSLLESVHKSEKKICGKEIGY